MGGERKKEKIRNNLQNKSKDKNNICFSSVTAVSVLSLTGGHSPPHLPRMPSNTVLIFGAVVGASQILLWSYSYVFLPPVPTVIGTSEVIVWTLSMTFYIFHSHRVCLVDHVDLICSLYSWWEGFGSSFLAILPLGFNCDFIFTFACGSSTGVCS